MFKAIKSIFSKLPLSLFGALALIFSFWLINLHKKSDIIASVIGSSLLILILFSFTTALVNYLFIRRSLKVVAGKTRNRNNFTNDLVEQDFTLQDIKIFPFMELSLQLKYKEEDLRSEITKIRKQQIRAVDLKISSIFPHRGSWPAENLKVNISDLFGFTSFVFNLPLSNVTKIKPKAVPYKERKLIVSSYNPGDKINIQQEPVGDYYDLKKYHPGDGLRKIAWKIYARTGELISRKQEQTAEPNGLVLVYALAKSQDDNIASEALNYLVQLKNYELDYLFSCNNSSEVVSSEESAEDILLASAFQTSKKVSVKDIVSDLGAKFATVGKHQKIAFFTNEDSIHLKALQDSLKNYQLEIEVFSIKTSKNLNKQSFIKKLFLTKNTQLRVAS